MRKYFIFAVVISFFALNLFSEQRDSIIYLTTADANTLDPGKVFSAYSADVTSNIFEGLLEYSMDEMKIKPCLATRWESGDNGKKWRFILRKNVKFNNGKPFDSADVLYSFLSRMEKMDSEYPEWKISFPDILKISAPDKYIIEIELKKPYAPFLTLLTYPIANIVEKGSYDTSDFKPVGTGPFKFEKWEKGRYLSLIKNREYWGDKPRINKIIFKTFSKPYGAINMIKSGQADVMELKSLELLQDFIGLKKFKITQSKSGGLFYLVFNMRKAPFNNIFFRKGFAHLIKKDIVIKTIFQNFVDDAITPIPEIFPDFNKNIKDYQLSIKKAVSFFKQSGIKSGFKCSVLFLDNEKSEMRIAEVFRRQAAKAGITLIKEPLPLDDIHNRLREGKFDMAIRGAFSGPDPDFYFFSNFTDIRGNTNFAHYINPELIKLLFTARETLDREKRKKNYLRVQEIIHNDVPLIPLFHPRSSIIHCKELKGIYFNSNSLIQFKRAYYSKD